MGYLLRFEDIGTVANYMQAPVLRDRDSALESAQYYIKLFQEDDNFQGELATNMKSYTGDVHGNIVNAFRTAINTFTMQLMCYNANLTSEIDPAFETEVRQETFEDLLEVYRLHKLDFEAHADDVQTALHKISDIFPMNPPPADALSQMYQDAEQLITGIKERTEAYEHKHAGDLDEFNALLDALESMIAEFDGKVYGYQAGDVYASDSYSRLDDAMWDVMALRMSKQDELENLAWVGFILDPTASLYLNEEDRLKALEYLENERIKRGGNIVINQLKWQENIDDLKVYMIILKLTGNSGQTDMSLFDNSMQNFATMNDGSYDGRVGLDEDFMKMLRTYSDQRQEEVDAGGFTRHYEENIGTYVALGDMMMQLGYVTMLWSSYVSYSQHYQTFAFNEDAELNKGYKGGEKISAEDVKVDERKFSEYALDPNKSNGKSEIFNSYGYDETNAAELSKLYQTQAQERFNAGDYSLGEFNEYGQRITINITIGEGSNTTEIKSGWIIDSDGSIRLVTPFAGFVD